MVKLIVLVCTVCKKKIQEPPEKQSWPSADQVNYFFLLPLEWVENELQQYLEAPAAMVTTREYFLPFTSSYSSSSSSSFPQPSFALVDLDPVRDESAPVDVELQR